MMAWAIAATAAAVLLFVLLFKFHREITRMNRQLKQMLDRQQHPFVREPSVFAANRQLIRHINEVLRQIERITEEKNKSETARKQLVSNISHDLRTPLTSLLGYVEMLDTDENLQKEEQAEYIRIVHHKARTLYELAEQFFELSRLEAGEEPLHRERINVSETVRQILFSYYEDFKARHLEPSLDLPDADAFAVADRRALTRILTNLIANSLRHGAGGDRFGVRVRDEADNVAVEVWDNGKGIPAPELDRIWSRMYTLGPSRNKALHGSGLGLHIVKQLVERMGGGIDAGSVPYERTSFVFRLPKDRGGEELRLL
ncbi:MULTISPECIES: sensor histidine kinase KdpD [unclassified Paenibacillus]|uniref:sensor histidine kinase n=1 Tax=unclassified Paenibacillus TaxID=185978 RepID=UPI001C107180|nr:MULTISPECIES: HAMP domain-containing sensor histidine kinase [unclassified Paenibacillus]MBU5442028.1 HAMP domain-containing histidine kinase [Paenibacillus sp. MSJ-34]CAH0120460.1 Adaptive-response sensory-kinase SasA [Paenibacillus sp. CECT 9249]